MTQSHEQYNPKYFKVEELVDPQIFWLCGNKALAMLNPDLLRAADKIREIFGPVIVNNWHVGGSYMESGLRRLDTKTGAAKSAHKSGMALDIKLRKATLQEVFKYLIANREEFPGITRIENPVFTKTWLHIDCVPHAGSGIKVFNP